MFAYCLNNPTNYADYAGYDAVVLFDEDTFGHIGIMAQDSAGRWWHFYWGTKGGKEGTSGRVKCFLGFTIEQYSRCVEYSHSSVSLDEVNASGQYAGEYENMHYLEGDFSEIIAALKNPEGQYNLYTNNCSQFSLRTLSMADTRHRELLQEASQFMLPAHADSYISQNLRKGSSFNFHHAFTYNSMV